MPSPNIVGVGGWGIFRKRKKKSLLEFKKVCLLVGNVENKDFYAKSITKNASRSGEKVRTCRGILDVPLGKHPRGEMSPPQRCWGGSRILGMVVLIVAFFLPPLRFLFTGIIGGSGMHKAAVDEKKCPGKKI